MGSSSCDYLTRYLDRFLDQAARERVDLTRISQHALTCPECYQRLRRFLHQVDLPESSFLRETLDELALALYNLGKAIIRDLPPRGPDDVTESVAITEKGGGSVDENRRAGVEMIEDAEDYAGSSRVGEMDLEELRQLIEDAEDTSRMRVDLALAIFEEIARLPSRYLYEAWNWIGVLHLQRGSLDRAEAALNEVTQAREGATNVRCFAHCNLGYLHKQRGDLDAAVLSAQRSVVFAQEDGKDPYFGRVAGLYFRLLRGGESDVEQAEILLREILDTEGGATRLRHDLGLSTMRPIRDVLQASEPGAAHPELFA